MLSKVIEPLEAKYSYLSADFSKPNLSAIFKNDQEIELLLSASDKPAKIW